MRTLVIHIGGIGDFLLSCPAIQRLAEDGPVALAGNRQRLELAVADGMAEATYDLDTIEFDSLFTSPSQKLQSFLKQFDRCVAFMRNNGEIKIALEQCGVPSVATFPGLPPDTWDAHASQYFLNAIRSAAPVAPFRLHIAPSSACHDILIHPGSGGARKNWPAVRFEELTLRLEGLGRAVSWILGPAEEKLSLPGGIDTIRKDALVDLAGELAAAGLYIGNDSGITHLAAAAGCPTAAIFGATNPRVWAPLGGHVKVITGNPWPSVDDVLNRIL